MLKISQRTKHVLVFSGLFCLLLSVIVLFSLELVSRTKVHHIARLFVSR
jgi:hypothetical protein